MSGRPKRIKGDNKDPNFEYSGHNSSTRKVSMEASASIPNLSGDTQKDIGADIAEMIMMLESRIGQLEVQQPKRRESVKSTNSPATNMTKQLKPSINTSSVAGGGEGLFPFDDDEQFRFPVHADFEIDQILQPKDGKNFKCNKSGYDIKVHENIQKRVSWPHGYLSKIQFATNTEPDNLDVNAFVYGYAAILMSVSDKEEIEGRLVHLKQIMWHAINNSWKSAREFHYAVLREIEVGNISWNDEYKMGMLSLSAAHQKQMPSRNATSAIKTNQNESAQTQVVRSICCKSYNYDDDGCYYEKSGGSCKKLHACSSCEKNCFYNKHKATECKK